MKKILNALFLALLAVITFSACSDVPSPYDIKGEGDASGLTGDGSLENPYTVEDLISTSASSTKGWVEGYIVGGIKSDISTTYIASAADVIIGEYSASVKDGVVLVASLPTETDYKKCIAVNLNKDGGNAAVKAALNLPGNADKDFPRHMKVKGTFAKNTWGLPGLIALTAAEIENGVIVGDGGDEGPVDQDNPFGLDDSNPLDEIKADFEEQPDWVDSGSGKDNQNYSYALEGWKNVSYVGDRLWTGIVSKKNEKYIQATAHNGAAANYTIWFVSPAFTVDKIKDKVITFDCAAAYFNATTTLKVYFLELQNGVMQKSEIAVEGIPGEGATDHAWVENIKIDLSEHTGKVGFIGFEYVAEGGASKSTTYRLDNIKSGKDGSDPTPEPGEEVVVTKDTPYEESFAGSFGKFTEDNKELGSLDYIWKVIADKDYVKATAFKGGAAVIAEGWLVSPILDLSTLSKVTLTFTQMSYSAGDKSEFMFKVKKEGETWKNVDIDMPVGNTFEELLTTVDLSAYAGSKMQFAFAYKNAKTSAANTWNIKNVKVAGEGGTPTPDPVFEQIFCETFEGEGGKSKDKLAVFKGYVEKGLTFKDNGIADVRSTTTVSMSLWLPANKPNDVVIEGFSTSGYNKLKLSYKIACNNAQKEQNIIKVKCGDNAVTVPSATLGGANEFSEVVIEDIPVGISTITFVSDEANDAGFRIDDIKLEGAK